MILTYDIQDAERRRTVKAKNWRDALKKAWRRDPPKSLGILMRIRDSQSRVWKYLDSMEALRAAGFKVEG